jgi:hypothetical protein
MYTFFRGRRRKAGVGSLLMACVGQWWARPMIDDTGFVSHCQEFGLTPKYGRLLLHVLDYRSSTEIA